MQKFYFIFFLLLCPWLLSHGQDRTTTSSINACVEGDSVVNIVMDYSLNCPEASGNGLLAGLPELAVHSGVNGWSGVVTWDDDNMQPAVNDGDDFFTFRVNTKDYYGVELRDVVNIDILLNQGIQNPSAPWDADMRDTTDSDGAFGPSPCSDMIVIIEELGNCDGSPVLPDIPHISGCVTDSNTLQIVFDNNQNCPEAELNGTLDGMSEIGFHSGINGWNVSVPWNADSATTAVNDGRDVFTVNVDPLTYYGTSISDIVNVTFLYNQGPAFPDSAWNVTGKDTLNGGFGGNEPCSDFDLLIEDLPQCDGSTPVDTSEVVDPEIPHIAGCITDSGTVQIVFDNKQNCPEAELEGNLDGMSEIGFHSGVNDWAFQTAWDAPGAMRAVNDGNDVFTVEINPLTYYNTGFATLDSVTIINFLYNQGPEVPASAWTVTGKDTTDGGGFGNNEPCSNFGLVLADLPYCRVKGPEMSGCVTDSGTVRIVFDNYQNCPEAEVDGNLDGMFEIGFHSGINGWETQVAWNDSTAKTAKNNGLDIYTVEINPAAYYGVPAESITEINFLYNQGPAFPDDAWVVTGKSSEDGGGFGGNEPCSNFQLIMADLETCETPPLPLAACITDDDRLQIDFDYNQNCPEQTLMGSFAGQQMIGFHSGVNGWNTQVAWDDAGAVQAVNNARNMYSLSINPAEYYGMPLDSITEINFLFNQGPAFPNDAWSATGKSSEDGGGFGNNEPCSNFLIVMADLETCSTVGIEERIVDLGLKVYPNPFSSQVTIEFDQTEKRGYDLYLIDMGGRILVSKENLRGNRTTIPRGDLASGVYMLMLKNSEGKIDYKKLVIQ